MQYSTVLFFSPASKSQAFVPLTDILVYSDPLPAWSGSEGSRKLRFPDFMTTAQEGSKVVSLTHRPHFPQEILLVLISVRDHSAIGRIMSIKIPLTP